MPYQSNGVDYNQMIQQAQGMYKEILGGYNRALQGQQARSKNINRQYNQLTSSVMGDLANTGRARSQEIADTYTQRVGAANQDLINRGLGNTTVASSIGRGYTLDEAKAQTDLADKLAGQRAQYGLQLGQQRLGYLDRANTQHTALQGQQFGYQGDWQKALLGAGLNRGGAPSTQEMALNLLGMGGGGRGGGGSGGGGYIGGDIMRGPTRSRPSYYDESLNPTPRYSTYFSAPDSFGSQGSAGGFNTTPVWQDLQPNEVGTAMPGYDVDYSGF